MTRLIVTAAAALALSACQGQRAEPAGNAVENQAEALEEQADAAPVEAVGNMPEGETDAAGNAAANAGAAAPPPVQASAPAPARVAAAAPNRAKGARIYTQTCIACHGANGKGALPGMPDLTAAAGRLAKPDAVLLRNMINGFQTPGSPMPMPPRGGNPDLTDQDMRDVLAHLRKSFGRP